MVSVLLTDPVTFFARAAIAMRELPERNRPIRPYIVDHDWEERLHARFGLVAPCAIATDLPPLWDRIQTELAAKRVRTGPMSYLGWNDGDRALVRAAWCLVHHLKAAKVVETGVGHGLTTRIVLEALARTGTGGRLWSIDFPPPLHPEWHWEIGIAVGAADRGNWSYVKGLSRTRLPALLRQTGPIDLFIHDSNHSEDNVLFEMREAWAALRTGGAMVIDDIDVNNGFHRFCSGAPPHVAYICEADPIRPDERRVNRKGMFGIIIKTI